MEKTMMNIEKEIGELTNSVKTAHKRIDDLQLVTKAFYDLASDVKVMVNEMTNMKKDINDIKDNIDEIILATIFNRIDYFNFHQSYSIVYDACECYSTREDFLKHNPHLIDDDCLNKADCDITFPTDSIESYITLESLLEIGNAYRNLPKEFQNEGTILLISLRAFDGYFGEKFN